MGEPTVEEVFIAGAKRGSLVWMSEPSGRHRVVEPYMLFCSTTGRRLLHLFQVGGYGGGGILRGWKNAEVSAFDDARLLPERFTPRADYDPFDEDSFPSVVFALPTRDGRARRAG